MSVVLKPGVLHWRAAVDLPRLPAQAHLGGGGVCGGTALVLPGSSAQPQGHTVLALGAGRLRRCVPCPLSLRPPAPCCVLLVEGRGAGAGPSAGEFLGTWCECGRAGEHTFPRGQLGGSRVGGQGGKTLSPLFFFPSPLSSRPVVPAGPGEPPSRSCITWA